MKNILSKENRKENILKIIHDEKNIEQGYGVRVKIQGEMKALPAYKIPLDCLIYNRYNGRIASRVKTFEKEYRDLNPEEIEDAKQIEQFLWESDEKKNEATMEDLLLGQNVAGVITLDGKIADGNRRVCLLNRILDDAEKNPKKYEKVDISKCKYFIAAVVEKDLSDPELLELELSVQLAEEKVGYNAIEKYLKCDQLKGAGFSDEAIKTMMRYDSINDVKKDYDMKRLMDEFLEYIGYSGIYTRLDEVEDPFLGLYSTIKKVDAGKIGKDFDWNPDELDLNDLKIASFNYIRADLENINTEKSYRYITGSNKDAFFKTEKAWKTYIETTKGVIDNSREEEKSFDDLRKENPGSKIEDLMSSRDKQWTEKIADKVKEGFGKSKSIVEAKVDNDKPVKLLSEAKYKIEGINPNTEAFYSKEVTNLLKELGSMIWELKKINEKGLKND